MVQSKNNLGYNIVTIRHEGKPRTISVFRALASTFLGSPPSIHDTADHDDRNRENNTLDNCLWKDKSEQTKNRVTPPENNSAFIVVKDGVELTVNEWVNVYKKPNGDKYHHKTIEKFAREQKNGFRYKTFQNLRGEIWKAVPGSKNKKGEWFISNMNRMKYKTKCAENVMTVDQLTNTNGYPSVGINGKNMLCHHISMMTFRPREYISKLPGDIILHKHDNKLDFNPFRLRWGTPSENTKDAYKNGKYDDTKVAQKPVASYINGVFEKVHESINAAVRYLKAEYSTVNWETVSCALKNDATRYGRTWKYL
ncbi:hypothetical protein ATCVTN60342_084L [Acanthocystis turfacea Chlorella virus TN603.4.2]|nr:hypothetical protein ATCVTN60342_084L [Acanthocystis turfacea Chlorella virus TN603.4.2]